ncbi:MAG: tRNA (guanosine(46)-N7)-methyltransferase TrmB [Eubacteriales bacterium]|nr:tRNA (guanosine(46)-N7)-methyltransferase TrmB [Eubacteriales bacterium]
MRLRYKKNLDERMFACKDYFLDRTCDGNALIAMQNPEFVDFRHLFGNDNPVCLEIGCGKGKFAIEYALSHPEQNILAVERLSNVIVSGAERAKELNLSNVRFLVQNAEFLPHFLPDSSVSKVFLNFSCPFPKKTYRNRRLTHVKFLDMYERLLVDGGVVEQKTDNSDFFDFSLESYAQRGWEILFLTRDMYGGDVSDNIATEYERRFVSQGMPINKVVARPRRTDYER